ncbi:MULTISPECIES: Rcs stress response system protein RcsF [unclassified Colwellia]|uniref:Rcs stress response system protein RcsF n=1 Tax=unclassified Colwellia TaxID=196834 RepID=UPI0015F36731|nr:MULTISPECIES: Rcs stress response system protein RcsF [unclassified Colwellia]MBA6233580.1 rcsF protein [Colwellia sp. MB02u-7]MBA6238140.1 rcsF protein [Colwellia sp. MB02u-11]MBA6255096.1 rcsF protein [Colwellia sp. MB3u-28]MBA6258953.1 rcsF protein [Colwellia sp. MB3u-41]MBA6299723.1 rcsF protein [Colwellia sp. MB3u-22]
MNTDNKYKKNTNMLRLMLIAASITLSACSSQYTVSTNLDKENFQTYFSHTQVNVIKDESELLGKYKLIGMVEGQDCQTKIHHAAPDKVMAKTQARRQAFKQHANAIIFTGCALINDNQADKQCIETVVCYGKAYQIEQASSIQ